MNRAAPHAQKARLYDETTKALLVYAVLSSIPEALVTAELMRCIPARSYAQRDLKGRVLSLFN